MKTQIIFKRVLFFVLVSLFATGAFAQQNQNPTQTVCVGSQPYNVDASALPGAIYTWSVSGGGSILSGQGTNSIIVDWTQAGGPYTLSVYTSANGCSGIPQSIDVTVVPQPVGPTLLAQTPAGPDVCDGTPVSASFNAGSGGVGCTDEFQYRYDGTGTWAAYTPGDQIATAGHSLVEIQGRRAGCAAGAGCNGTAWVTLATWNVTPLLTPTVTIASTTDPVCEGTSVTYTANVTNGGTPTYEWRVNNGPVVGSNSTYTYVPQAGDVITCTVVSNAACTSTVPVTGSFTPTVNPLPTTSGIWHN